MTAIIIIIFASLLLYKLGGARLMLEAATVGDYYKAPQKPRRKPAQRQRQQAEPEPLPVYSIEERKHLERIAANILTAHGARHDVWGEVRGKSTRELQTIINEGTL